MINAIWLGLMLISIALGFYNGTISEVVTAVTASATQAVQLAIGLIGIMSFWLGLMSIAEKAGIVAWLAKVFRPLLQPLFPDIPKDHPAMGAITLNLTANFMGLGNAATPFGLRAMAHLKELNRIPGVASNAMCTFLALNTSSVQLIPVTAIAILALHGDPNPTRIILPTLVATSCSTITAIIAVKCLQNRGIFNKHLEDR
jgi:spore maturation protein A